MLRERPFPLSSDKCEGKVREWQERKMETDKGVEALDLYLSKRWAGRAVPFALIRSGDRTLLLTLRSSDTEGPFELLLHPHSTVKTEEEFRLSAERIMEDVIPSEGEALRLPFLFGRRELYLLTVQGALGASAQRVKAAARRLKDILHALEELLSRTVFMLSPTSNYYVSEEHREGVRLPFSIYQNLFEGRGEREVVVDGVAEEGYLKFALGAYPYVEECGRGKGYSIPARPLKRRKRNREVRAVALFPEEVGAVMGVKKNH